MIKETCAALIRLLKTVEPNTAITHGRVLELKTLPSLVLEGPALSEIRAMRSQAKITAKDLANKAYVREKAPRWYNLSFNVTIGAEKYADILDRIEALSRLAQRSNLIAAKQEGTGRERAYAWDWQTIPSSAGAPNFSGVYNAAGRLTIYAVEAYSDIQETGPLIMSIELDFEGDKNTITDTEQEG